MQAGKKIVINLYRFLLQSKLYHLIFWAVYIVFCALIVQPGKTPLQWVYYSSVILFFHACVAYFNNYVLVNQFLYRRQYITYVLGLLLSIMAASFPISIVFHSFVHNHDLKTLVWSSNFFFLNGVSIFLTTLIIMALKLFTNWYSQDQRNRDLLEINLETELKFLKAQINPHFLFNSLNNLYALTLKKSDLAPEVVLKLSNILRYVLYETSEGKVPLTKEVQYLRDYVELEKIRLGDRVDICLDVEKQLVDRDIEPMLFLTFVENSFKHGVNASLENGWVKILIGSTRDKIQFSISNSKSGYKADTVHGGIGLENLKKRLDLLYRGKYSMEVLDDSQSYQVNLEIQT